LVRPRLIIIADSEFLMPPNASGAGLRERLARWHVPVHLHAHE